MIGVSNITNRTDPNSLKSRVFVGNLNTVQMSKTELEGIFAKYGAVIGISVHKGYAFIQYSNEASARAAVIGEDSKAYYNMVLDVTIASEPKNRKRGRTNVNANIPTWSGLSSPGLSELALQAQALNTLANNPLLSLQQLGLEGIMGQPNLAQFAAAASSVLNTTPFNGVNVAAAPTSIMGTRPKYTRLSTTSSISPSIAHLSSAAKRTRLDGTTGSSSNFSGSSLSLPSGARGQNLVSLVSPTDSTGSGSNKPSQGRQIMSPNKPLDRTYRQSSDQGYNVSSGSQNRSSSVRQSNTECSTAGGSHNFTSSSSVVKSASIKDAAQLKRSPLGGQSLNPTTNDQEPLGRLYGQGAGSSANVGGGGQSGRPQQDDILICGNCRRLFDQVDELISHKMAGCSLEKFACERCRCRADEPNNVECAYCGANYHSAWELVLHCHKDHGLTIYSLPSPTTSPRTSFSYTSLRRKGSSTASSSAADESDAKSSSAAAKHRRASVHSSEDLKLSDGEDGPHGSRQSPSSDILKPREASDWEADDEYDEVAESPNLDANSQNNSKGASKNSDNNATPTSKDNDEHDGEEEPTAKDDTDNESGHGQKRTPLATDIEHTKTEDSASKVHEKSGSLHHRSRRGEHGRHETMVDEDDEDEEDDTESKVARSS
ncbi:unnamed protein product [Calicophoron daubneyi]|uniref:RRM domain-containing protein n=1 Tax=Calicophoron daubneyi TaxID=300641 RepID=A0AAV2TZS6_CALDB